jgi:hypothetical protein
MSAGRHRWWREHLMARSMTLRWRVGPLLASAILTLAAPELKVGRTGPD